MSCRIKIVHLYPELLNLYGDVGNVAVLEKRCAWRGIEVEVAAVRYGGRVRLADADLVYLGSGTDREQRAAHGQLLAARGELRSYVEDGGAMLAACGGFELVGESLVLEGERVDGLGLVDARVAGTGERLVGNVLLEAGICDEPVVGYENHAGRMSLGAGVEPFGRVVRGNGNDGVSGSEGCVHRSLLGTYLHGPLLPKNPGVADWLLVRALERKGAGVGVLAPLDDAVELAANRLMAQRMLDGED